jgi:protein-glutamine gamma-glutamyltransferase
MALNALAPSTRWPAWSRLPRDARDTLFLLAVIAWTVLPHVSHLPWWCSLLTATMLAWRAILAIRQAPLPGRWWLVVVLAVAAGLTFWTYRSLLGKEPGITMLVVLMALKTLELRARRDAFVVFFLGFFLVLTHFLYSQSMPVALAMLVSVWGLLTAVVLAHMPVGQPSLRQAGALSARTALLGAPVMVLLFVLFPRIGPLWGVPQDGIAGTGLSDTMKMGSVSELVQDDRVAMRIRFDGPVPPPAAMYFRGPVLSRFDGTEWRSAPALPAASGVPRNARLRINGQALRHEITLEPLRMAVLPLLEATVSVSPIEGYRIGARDDLQWNASRPVLERLRFTAEAHTEFRHGPTVDSAALREFVELPPGFNPRTLAWAAALRQDPRYATADGRTLADALMQRIRTENYVYTLAPGDYGRDAVDEFWLDRKEGFCEHFAAAFVVVMRALDVPARVVTGYQGAEPGLIDGYTVVRQSSAHAWAEYWQAGIGWVRADPTAAVAPERIQGSRRLQPPPGVVAGALGTVSPALLARLRDGWEAINNRWNQWVLNYSRGQQFDLLERLGWRSPSWEDLALLLTAALSSLALAGAAWAWWDRHRVDPWTRQRAALLVALGRLGITAGLSDPPRALARKVRAHCGGEGEALAQLLERLEQQRFGREARRVPDASLTREFTLLSRQLARRSP